MKKNKKIADIIYSLPDGEEKHKMILDATNKARDRRVKQGFLFVGATKSLYAIAFQDAIDWMCSKSEDPNVQYIRALLKTKLPDLNMSTRLNNTLKDAGIFTLGEVVSYNKHDFFKIRNFGKKTLTELEHIVQKKGLMFGMNVEKYK